MILGALECDNMAGNEDVTVTPGGLRMFDEPLTALFWRGSRVMRFKCVDCSIEAGPEYTEITLRSEDDRDAMFIITDDPDIDAQMTGRTFTGFQLRSARGNIIEQITTTDPRSVN